MVGTDTAQTIEDGSFESGQAGGDFSHLSKHVQAEIQRRAPLATAQKLQAQEERDTEDLWRLAMGMNPDALEAPMIYHGVSAASVWRGAELLPAARMADDGFDWAPVRTIDDAA